MLLLARPPVPAALPPVAHADTETVTNVPFTASLDAAGRFRLSLACLATPTNNVEAAFGVDRNGDGVLALEETDCVVGWDCGEWVTLGARPQDAVRSPAQTTNVTKRLQWNLYEGNGVPRNLAVTENGSPVPLFDGIRPPDWLLDPGWDTVRLTVRGTDAPNERFRAQMIAPGTRISIR